MLRRLIPAVAIAALAVPAAASAKDVHGTVVQRSHDGHHFIVANCGRHTLTRIHGARHAPRVGQRVDVDARRHGNRWFAHRVHKLGRFHGLCRIEGTITAVDPTHRTLTIAADDHGDDNAMPVVTVAVPARFDITEFTVGQRVELKVVAQPKGGFTLVRVDEDRNDDHGARGDDPAGHDQGDDRGNDPAGHDRGDDRGDDAGDHDRGDDNDNSGPGNGNDDGDNSGPGGGGHDA